MNTRGRTVGIIVARMGSSRVPGKTMLDINGISVIERIIRNVRCASGLDSLIVATTSHPRDDAIEEASSRLGINCHRGDPENVLDRVFVAALSEDADVIVEIGGDCPFIGPDVLEPAIEYFHSNDYDYLSNYDPPTYPEGFDINIITIKALARAYKDALAPSQRIHPFSYLSFHPSLFKIGNAEYPGEDLSRFHWSLDFPEDITFIRRVYHLLGDTLPSIIGILDCIERDEELKLMHNQLLRPPSNHAFWSAPSIIRDMNKDIASLAHAAIDLLEDDRFNDSHRVYLEMNNILAELIRFSDFRKGIKE